MDDFSDTPGLTRRKVLKRVASSGMMALALAELPLLLRPAFAADAKLWPEDAFRQKSEDGVLQALYGKTAAQSDKISLDAPEIAENGAVVPVAVTSSLPKITAVAILVLNNPFTLAAAFHIPDGTAPAVASRIKMAKTSHVVAVVESDGKLYSTSKQVKVTVGGCGG